MDELIASFLAIVFMGIFLRLMLFVADKLKRVITQPVKVLIPLIVVQTIIVVWQATTLQSINAQMNIFVCVLLALSIIFEFVLFGIMIVNKMDKDKKE